MSTSNLITALAEAMPLALRSYAVDAQPTGLVIVDEVNGFCTVGAGNLAPLWREARAAAGRFAGVTYTWQPRGRSVDLLGH